MFRVSRTLRPIFCGPGLNIHACFTSASTISSNQPNAPLDLDPSLRALLKDVDMSLVHHKSQQHKHTELQVLPINPSITGETDVHDGAPHEERYTERKSPAAHFGSQRIGTVVLPFELRKSIGILISDSDKHKLRIDAKRIFHNSEETTNASESKWDAQYDVDYRSRRQAAHRSERDGTAFACIALPAHYSAIYSVLNHVKVRLGPDWNVDNVIDWGTATGSGLWASLHSFQESSQPQGADTEYEPQISQSSVVTYLGLDKRDGLVSIGKRLLRDVNRGSVSLKWQKSLQEEDKVKRSDGHNVLALSAFLLSSLPTDMARKALVKEMWESGAHVMVLIDHNTKLGFECIAESREYLLNMGRKEIDDNRTQEEIHGSYVVAPCPHDSACPLHHPGPTSLVCGFSQRLQRPPFIRVTKHSGVGHEDIEYSYVVVRRGTRPTATHTKVGRIGEVGQWALEKEASRTPMRELTLHDEVHTSTADPPRTTASPEPFDHGKMTSELNSPAELLEALRLEAFNWPRLVFPPLKRSGHIILDSCTAEGKIMRLTIPKSQGKQEFYDARKSSWGDIFPHEPKNPPQERHQPIRAKREGGTTPTRGQDIGKRRRSSKSEGGPSYAALSKELQRQRRKDRNRSDELGPAIVP